MLAARSIIWNTWEIYFWEIFFFFPAKVQERDFIPVTIDTESIPLSCFSLTSLESASEKRLLKTPLAAGGTLFPPMQLQIPLLSYIAIKHWTHLLFANFTCGIHCQARQLDSRSKNLDAELRKILSCLSKRRGPVHIGKDCQIDPTATIIGPTTIGNGVIVGPNVTISAGCIGDHALLEPNSLIWLGVLGARSSLLANRNIVMSCVMNDSIINTDVRFSIVGNYSFLGGG
jgi:UDP-N-acetylglucosamine diphosphorylase / glucose-1-phosphate thymidylyltransferase / UDP-N-acetylgalactosamine diphosphorylase / glucosamine-1-phosphate N-acetyltransferase / galactosamine-1-phosphate N-acetyltransferase